MKKSALIFGYNEYSQQIAQQIESSYESLHIYTLSQELLKKAEADGFSASIFELGDEWLEIEIERSCTIDDVMVFCTLEDDANNIFLTISLRAAFESLYIVALAKDAEGVNKLKIAGANKVLPIVQMTTNVITEILEKPVVTNVLHQILYEESEIKIAQVDIVKGSTLIGSKSHDIDFKKEFNLILLAIVDRELSTHFIFTAKGFNHIIDEDDVLVIVGLQNDIDTFVEKTGGEIWAK
jgi:Trk K+ transport system NAD-binding subunit